MSNLDLGIIAVYMVSMILIGIACRGRQESESDYFTGHGGFPQLWGAILVGLSIAATFFSGISMLAYPSVAYQQGAVILVGVIVLPLAAVIAGRWFLPRYLKTGTKEPYEIIERRFGYPTRAAAATLFLLLRIAWMGTLIYAPTSAIIGGFGLDQKWFWVTVVGLGLSSTLYTVLGGIRGVIITDAIQFVVMIAGVLVPVAVVLARVNVDWLTAWEFLRETGRLNWVSFSLNPAESFTFWSMAGGFIVGNLGVYVADQMALQRYLASEDIKAANRAFVINVGGVIIVICLLVAMGLSLALFYGLTKPGTAPLRADDVFPHFIATELPAGAPGLIFAAILAATMSSMTSGINALAGTIVLDFMSRSTRFANPRQRLNFARITSLVIGILATATAGLVGRLGSIFEIAQVITGVFLGPLLVCMFLAVSSWQISTLSVRIGMAAGIAAGWIVILTPADRLWVGPMATLASAALPVMEIAWRYCFHPLKATPQAID